MIKSKHFKIHELIPPKAFQKFGEKGWILIDPTLIELLDAMRNEFGRATINNYMFGGDRQWSGLRTTDSPDYTPYSQHSFGRAADIIFNDIKADDVRKSMISNPEKWLKISPSITLEDDVSWLHVDIRNNHFGINLFKP